ncbi:MAG: signal peptidase II [Candidatus Sericytochromatia bacterium]|nr:signal peptidase II [Candidatus Sericytochromatia bacterium]
MSLSEDAVSPRRSTLVFYLTALCWLALDQWSKSQVVQHIPLGSSMPVIAQYFALTHVTNTGGAWSLLAGKTIALGILSLAVCVGIMVYEQRLRQRVLVQTLGLAFLLGGAAGNMIDRLRLQHVVDMFDLQWHGHNIFPIFNVADIGIDVGVGLLLLVSFLERPQVQAQPAAPESAT